MVTMTTVMIKWHSGDSMATMTPLAPMVRLDYHRLSQANGYMAIWITITANGANSDQWCHYRHWHHWCQRRPMVIHCLHFTVVVLQCWQWDQWNHCVNGDANRRPMAPCPILSDTFANKNQG
jgi:hypothetical protein